MRLKNPDVGIILIPILLLASLMTTALIQHPILLNRAIAAIIITVSAMIIYFYAWKLLKPDDVSRKWGLVVGVLFIINISVEDFIGWKTKAANLDSTLAMMFLIFISFAVISTIKTTRSGKITEGVKSSLSSACLGALIAICFGFLLCYLFPTKMTEILRGDRGFSDYGNPKEFIFYNAFDNASSHVIIAPIVSLVMGGLGGAIALLILRLKKNKRKAVT